MPDDSVEFRRERTVPKGSIHYPFWFGGSASCFAACVTHPLDLIKVRLQTQPHDGPRRNMVQMFVHIFSEHGVPGLYRGLSASIMRQATYSTTRFGVYETLKDYNHDAHPKETPSTFTLIGLSSLSGFLGGLAGNPADVLNVRMQHDAALPPAERRNYKNAIDGMFKMARTEGVQSLFRGVWPNSFRGVLMTASQLASYDSFKHLLLTTSVLGNWQDDLTTHFSASLMAGFVATTVCSPVDVIKTRVMSAKTKASLPALLRDIVKKEGFTWCFKGWVPSFIRLGPHTIATFMFLEQHKKLWRQYLGVKEAEQ